MFGAFYGSKLELYCGNCIYAVIGLRLLWTLNNFLEQRLWDAKFHHNYSYSSSSSSSSSKTRQVTCFRRYSGDTRRYPKNEKTIPHHQSPTSFQKKNTSPKFKRTKPNTIQFPNGTDTNTIGTFQTYKTQVKRSMIKNTSSKTPLGRSMHRLPEIVPPN